MLCLFIAEMHSLQGDIIDASASTKTLRTTNIRSHVHTSVAVLAEISLKSPRKILIHLHKTDTCNPDVQNTAFFSGMEIVRRVCTQ